MPDFPPSQISAPDSEKVILGTMLVSSEHIGAAAAELEGKDFFDLKHRDLFASLVALHDEHHREVDIVMVRDRLARDGALDRIGGIEYLAELAECGYPATLKSHVGTVKDKSHFRKYTEVLDTAVSAAMSGHGDPEDLISDTATSLLDLVRDTGSVHEYRSLPAIVTDVFAEILLRSETGTALPGIKTGLMRLDDLLVCMEPGTLNVIGARPSVGKTAFGWQMATSLDGDWPGAWFSLEMTERLMGYRQLALASGVDMHRLRTAKGLDPDFDLPRLRDAADAAEGVDLEVHVAPGLTLARFEVAAKRAMARGRKAFFIDHLHLMRTPRADNRNLALGAITSGLKAFAQANEVVVVLLCQLRRLENHTRAPRLDDLRESGGIEQDADNVILVHRPDKEETGEDPFAEARGAERAQMILAKNRQGPTGIANVDWLPEQVKFADPPIPAWERANPQPN